MHSFIKKQNKKLQIKQKQKSKFELSMSFQKKKTKAQNQDGVCFAEIDSTCYLIAPGAYRTKESLLASKVQANFHCLHNKWLKKNTSLHKMCYHCLFTRNLKKKPQFYRALLLPRYFNFFIARLCAKIIPNLTFFYEQLYIIVWYIINLSILFVFFSIFFIWKPTQYRLLRLLAKHWGAERKPICIDWA